MDSILGGTSGRCACEALSCYIVPGSKRKMLTIVDRGALHPDVQVRGHFLEGLKRPIFMLWSMVYTRYAQSSAMSPEPFSS